MPRLKCFLFLLLPFLFAAAFACAEDDEAAAPAQATTAEHVASDWPQSLREQLIEEIQREGVSDEKVLAAMRKVPRHEFVPERYRHAAYENHALPIGLEQTISQPFIVGYMTQALELEGGEKVLEIGTGSGYQAAVLAEIAGEVYTIEILEPLGRNAERTLNRLGYDNVHVKIGDGYQGWPEHAPFDAILVTAAPDHVPQPLVEQLDDNGRMVIPIGSWSQRIVLITKTADGVVQKLDIPVRFVPMTGEAQQQN
jgi:protein-L-isoaspartate(D-aspartate) O-methyltransferase